MLKELNVAEQTYAYECNVKGEVIEYLLYDTSETWIETKTKEEVLQTVQQLNKRIKHDVSTALDTLQNTLPESATWVANDNQPEASDTRERVLKLKYRVKGYPFHFEWHLKQHDDSLTIQLPANQVSSLVNVLPKTVEELLLILQRKQHEINQYKREYGGLRRSTLATNTFDMETFREQYADTDMNVKSLQRIVARWLSAHGKEDSAAVVESSPSNKGSPSNIIKKEEQGTSATSIVKTVQESPRSKKRKALHSYKTHMMRSLQSGNKKLEYESQSQSQSQSLSDAEPIETNVPKKVRENVEDVGNVNVNKATPAKSVVKRVNTPRSRAKISKTPIIADGSEPTKEVASNCKTPSANRPNTRQRRRECQKDDLNATELELMETTGESVLTALNESPASAKKITTIKVISRANNHNVKHKVIKSAQTLVKPQLVKKLEITKTDLSTYVDSMLSELEALDKELRG